VAGQILPAVLQSNCSGETGAIPVRARRREAYLCVGLTCSHMQGQVIGEI